LAGGSTMTATFPFESLCLPDTAAKTVMDPDGDAGLVVRALAGDKQAEEALYRHHVQYVHGLLLRLLGSHTEAEDAVQETFVIALDQLGQLRKAGRGVGSANKSSSVSWASTAGWTRRP